MKTKTLNISSVFPAAPAAIWERLTQVETLRYITAPYASFSPIGSRQQPVWCADQEYRFRVRLCKLLPLGVHTIRFTAFNRENGLIISKEGNRMVPVWNHTISLRAIDTDATIYTDQIEIGAGWRTGIVVLWAGAFYRHRQKRWLRLLNEQINKSVWQKE